MEEQANLVKKRLLLVLPPFFRLRRPFPYSRACAGYTRGELCRIARECVELARASHDETTLKLALMLAAKVRAEYPAQAKAAGL